VTGCPAKPRRVRGAGAAALGMCLYLRSKAGLRWLPLVICAPLALSADRDLPPTERARGPVDDRLSFGSCVRFLRHGSTGASPSGGRGGDGYPSVVFSRGIGG